MTSPVITTPRLVLRPFASDDAAALRALINDWDVASMLGQVPHPYTQVDARYFVDELSPHLWNWAITRDGELIGSVGFTSQERGWLFGCWLGKAVWGQGYASEAARAALATLPPRASHADIRSGCFTDNPASRRVLEKLGFTCTGQSRHACAARGHEVDHWDFALKISPSA